MTRQPCDELSHKAHEALTPARAGSRVPGVHPIRHYAAFILPGLVAGALLFVAGCKHVEPKGSVVTTFIDPHRLPVAAVDAKELTIEQPTDVFQEVKAIEPLTEPLLPAAWAKQVTMPIRIVVRVDIDEQGRVTNVERSLRDFSPSNDFGRSCFEAIRDAVARWRFTPAVIAHLEPAASGKPVIVSQRNVDSTVEVAFTLSSTQGVERTLTPSAH